MGFIDELNKTLGKEFSFSTTENGAIGYITTQKPLLDMNYKVPYYRNSDELTIIDDFIMAFHSDKILTLKWLFFARDVRGGLGERRLFRTIIKWVANTHPEYVSPLISLIPEYGRWDDLLCLIHTKCKHAALKEIIEQFHMDVRHVKQEKPVSLLGKWLPSENASSKETKSLAYDIMRAMDISPRMYRKYLSLLRKQIGIVETNMSSNRWDEINYESVPSKASLIYKDAFNRHDEERYMKYLQDVKDGKTAIHSGALYPHEIVHKYMDGRGYWGSQVKSIDDTLEELWKALPDTVQGESSTIVVKDGSGSMLTQVSGNTTAMEVANALAIYFAERCEGEFKNKFITFSENPKLLDIGKGNDLKSKLELTCAYNEVANTDIVKVFNLILHTAINASMSQEDLPGTVLIISDMEFDGMTAENYHTSESRTLFGMIKEGYERYGYKLPRLVFWNVASRTNTIPVTENDLGVVLVSGFSTNIVKMVLSGKTDPWEALTDTINSSRYQPIEEALKEVIK